MGAEDQEGETGWAIPPQDPQALTDRPRLVRMGQAGREWYEHQRQAEVVALQEMYGRLQGEK